MTVSIIMTVRNEASSIAILIDSLLAQTVSPAEIVVCDGGSTDATVDIVGSYVTRGAPVRLIQAPGANISVGRNLAVAAASGDIIASTDAGVRLASDWLERLSQPFAGGDGNLATDVTSGFFVADPQSVFETAMGATVLPALSDIRPDAFLPSSRSVAFSKVAWLSVGGYPEWLDYCEDLVFDMALKRHGFRFTFAPGAVAFFRPRSSLSSFFRQYYRYARGDGKADLFRKRHAIRYVVYMVAPLAMFVALRYNVLILWPFLIGAAGAYCRRPWQRLWPQMGGWRTRDRLGAILVVPAIRLVGDMAKMAGYPAGVWWRLRHRHPEG